MTEADIVRRYWHDLWGGGDLSVIDELFSEPYLRHNRNGTERLTRAKLKVDFRRYFSSLGAARVVRIDNLVVDTHGHVWSRVNIRGRDAETDALRVVTFLHEARIADGLIVETWTLTAAEVDWASTKR